MYVNFIYVKSLLNDKTPDCDTLEQFFVNDLELCAHFDRYSFNVKCHLLDELSEV